MPYSNKWSYLGLWNGGQKIEEKKSWFNSFRIKYGATQYSSGCDLTPRYCNVEGKKYIRKKSEEEEIGPDDWEGRIKGR